MSNVIRFRVIGHPEPYAVDVEAVVPKKHPWQKPWVKHYPRAGHKQWAETVAVQAASHRPAEKIDVGVELRMTFILQKGRSVPKDPARCTTPHSIAYAMAPITKPDLTGMGRVTEDVFTKLEFWLDDSRVIRQVNEKRWTRGGEEEGVEIEVRWPA